MNLGIHTDYGRNHSHIRRAPQGLECNIYNEFSSDVSVFMRQKSSAALSKIKLYQEIKFLDVQIARAKFRNGHWCYKDEWLRNSLKDKYNLEDIEDIYRDENSGKIIRLGGKWKRGTVKAIYSSGNDVFVETILTVDRHNRFMYYRGQFEYMKKYDFLKAKRLAEETHDKKLTSLVEEWEKSFHIITKGGK